MGLMMDRQHQLLKCNYCDKIIEGFNDRFKCRFCGEHHCSTHRLPEDHNCLGLKETKEIRLDSWTYAIQRLNDNPKDIAYINNDVDIENDKIPFLVRIKYKIKKFFQDLKYLFTK